jgi:hypothetical protein
VRTGGFSALAARARLPDGSLRPGRPVVPTRGIAPLPGQQARCLRPSKPRGLGSEDGSPN